MQNPWSRPLAFRRFAISDPQGGWGEKGLIDWSTKPKRRENHGRVDSNDFQGKTVGGLPLPPFPRQQTTKTQVYANNRCSCMRTLTDVGRRELF